MCQAHKTNAQIAQLVEQRTENPRVAGSIPALGIRGCSSMVEHQPSKLDTWVRFPSPAALKKCHLNLKRTQKDIHVFVAQLDRATAF